jgi:hypothetical protein
MNFVSKSENVLRNSFVLMLLLAGLAVGMAIAQHKPSAPAPKPSAPKAKAPAARPSTTRPSTATHSSTNGSRPGTAGTRTTPGTARAGTAGRTGTGTAGRTGNAGGAGRTGTPAAANRTGGSRPGGNGSLARTGSRPAPGRQVSLKGGGTASIRPNGQIRSINRNGMHIEHGLNGSRRIESTHNGAHIVTTGRGSGYVQRAYVTRGGRSYVSRTTIINHRAYTGVYRSYSFHGHAYYGYHPAFYYGHAYYGWAYNPWAAPVYYGWGWGGAPWYGFYGAYFAPYPVYPSAAFWLTDYLIAANLQAAYAAQAAASAAANGAAANGAAANGAAADQTQDSANNSAPADNSGSVTLSPEVKAAIAEEVKAQLAAEQAAAAQPASSGGQPAATQASAAPASDEVPPALDPARRTFVVASDLAVVGDGQECQLTSGDVITRITDTPDDDNKVTVSVSAGKKADCAAGKQVAVSVDDLQEMQNHFQEQLDSGMKDLASKQGTGGLPKAPDTTTVASDVPPPPPDTSAEKTLQDQQAAADQTEAQVVKEAFSQGS